jgi:hypothetical protein
MARNSLYHIVGIDWRNPFNRPIVGAAIGYYWVNCWLRGTT